MTDPHLALLLVFIAGFTVGCVLCAVMRTPLTEGRKGR